MKRILHFMGDAIALACLILAVIGFYYAAAALIGCELNCL